MSPGLAGSQKALEGVPSARACLREVPAAAAPASAARPDSAAAFRLAPLRARPSDPQNVLVASGTRRWTPRGRFCRENARNSSAFPSLKKDVRAHGLCRKLTLEPNLGSGSPPEESFRCGAIRLEPSSRSYRNVRPAAAAAPELTETLPGSFLAVSPLPQPVTG